MAGSNALQAVAEAVDRACAKHKWSMAQLAREIGMTDESLGKWRSGKTVRMDLEKLVALFKLAGLSMDEAFQLEPAKPKTVSFTVGRTSYTSKEVDEALQVLGWAMIAGVIRPGAGVEQLHADEGDGTRFPYLMQLAEEPSNAAVVGEMTQIILKRIAEHHRGDSDEQPEKTGY